MNAHKPALPTPVRRIVLCMLVVLVTAGTLVSAPAAQAVGPPHEVLELAITFDVLNVNRSPIPCATDGGKYEIGGHLVARRDALGDGDLAATVLIPGAVATERSAWRQKGFDGRYDVADGLARAGHTVVTINRLSFDTSGVPNGNLNCIGGEVDVIAQVLTHLRNGTYEIASDHHIHHTIGTPAFDRIALGGQSGGGMFATATAYSFPVVDALVIIASAVDQGMPPELTASIATISATECGQGGLEKHRGGPTGYTTLLPLVDEFFGDIEPAVKADFIARAEREPCGVVTSLPATLAANRSRIPLIDIPVLFIAAEHDWAFPPNAVQAQRDMFVGSSDVSYALVEEAGHTLMIERGIIGGLTASERMRHEMSEWLTPRGF